MNIEIGQEIELDPMQLAIITGVAVESLSPEHMFSWGKGRFRVGEVNGSACKIVRLASTPTSRGTEPAVQKPEVPGLALEPFQNPEYQPGAGVTTNPRKPKLGPLEQKVRNPGTMEAGGIVEKSEVFGPELKQPHTWILRSPQLGENKGLEDQSRTTWASRDQEVRAVLRRMLGFREKKLSPNEELEAIKMLVGNS